MHTVKGRRYAGTEEAAKFLGISSQTLRTWILSGKLPEVEVWTVTGRRSRCFTQSYLLKAAELRRPGMTAEDVGAWVSTMNIDAGFGDTLVHRLQTPARPTHRMGEREIGS